MGPTCQVSMSPSIFSLFLSLILSFLPLAPYSCTRRAWGCWHWGAHGGARGRRRQLLWRRELPLGGARAQGGSTENQSRSSLHRLVVQHDNMLAADLLIVLAADLPTSAAAPLCHGMLPRRRRRVHRARRERPTASDGEEAGGGGADAGVRLWGPAAHGPCMDDAVEAAGRRSGARRQCGGGRGGGRRPPYCGGIRRGRGGRRC